MRASTPTERALVRLTREIRAQEAWIRERGRTLAGYRDTYGSASEADHYGDGAEAIYEADWTALRKLQAEQDAMRERFLAERRLAQ